MRVVDRRTKVTPPRRAARRCDWLSPRVAAGMAIAPDAAWAQAAKNLAPDDDGNAGSRRRATSTRTTAWRTPTTSPPCPATTPASREVRDLMAKRLRTRSTRRPSKRFGTHLSRTAAETDRVAILAAMEKSRSSRSCACDLVVSLYNQKAVWPKFGYEGSSADKGGYINRGFDDIDWLS